MSPTSTPSPDTGTLPAIQPGGIEPGAIKPGAIEPAVIEPDLAAAASAIDEADAATAANTSNTAAAPPTRPGLVRRIVGSISDPVLRILVIATLISRVGRGVFLTVTVLYFTLIVGLAAQEVAIVLAAASAAGVLSSLAVGACSLCSRPPTASGSSATCSRTTSPAHS